MYVIRINPKQNCSDNTSTTCTGESGVLPHKLGEMVASCDVIYCMVIC